MTFIHINWEKLLDFLMINIVVFIIIIYSVLMFLSKNKLIQLFANLVLSIGGTAF